MRLHRFTVCFLFFSFCFYLVAAAADPDRIEDVIKQVKAMKDGGASNREIAEYITRIVDNRITNANSTEGYWSRGVISFAINEYTGVALTEGLEKDKKYMKERENLGGRNTPGKEYADRAQWSWDLKYGACNEISNITYYILKEAGIKDAKILEVPGHNFTVFGLDPDAKVSHPYTWGKDAVVADGWQGKTFNPDSAFRNGYIGNNGNYHPLDVTITYDQPKRAEIFAQRQKLCADLALQAELDAESGSFETAQQAVQEFKRNQCPGLKGVAPLRAGLEDLIKKRMMNPKEDAEEESGEEEIEDWPEDDQEAEELAEEFANADESDNDDDTVEDWPADDETTAETQTPPPVEEQRPPASKCDLTGRWRRSGWTQYALFTITQSGNTIQWGHDYLWGAGMRHEQANGTVTETGSGSATVVVDIDYDEPDGSHSRAKYGGNVTCENGKATSVYWNNNSAIVRE